LRLPIFDKNQGTILQAQAELQRAQAEVARLELRLRREFAEAFADYESSRLLAETYRREALPRAEESLHLYLESFKDRRAAWPQVLDAQRDYYELSEEYWDRILGARRAQARIASFFLTDGLSQPPEPTPEGHRDATPKPR
jgi:cobalt-zinc-cadmium efflux system outer membrane protein